MAYYSFVDWSNDSNICCDWFNGRILIFTDLIKPDIYKPQALRVLFNKDSLKYNWFILNHKPLQVIQASLHDKTEVLLERHKNGRKLIII